MSPRTSSSRWRRAWLPLLTGLVILLIDQVTKEWALRALSPVGHGPRIRVIPGFLDFLLAFNPGGAFSIFHERPWIITAGSALITVGIVIWAIYWCATAVRDVWSIRLAFGLILGGAVGNLIDRIRFQVVIDFIHAYVRTGGREYAWPTFNVADMGIVVGIGIFMYLSLFTHKLDQEPVEERGQPESAGEPDGADGPDGPDTAMPPGGAPQVDSRHTAERASV